MGALEEYREWLEEHGCDGLTCGCCSCDLEHLCECGQLPEECVPGKRAEQ